MDIVTIYNGTDVCPKCLGWKRVADSEDGESWKFWAELPAPSNLAVVAGLVKPIECPACHGTGQRMERFSVTVDLDRVIARRNRLYAVCETIHALLDEGCALRAETIHEGKTILAMLYDAMDGEIDD